MANLVHNACLLISMVMLANSAFSVMQYRKYLQMIQSEEQIDITVDILVEVFIAMFLGIASTVYHESFSFKRTRL